MSGEAASGLWIRIGGSLSLLISSATLILNAPQDSAPLLAGLLLHFGGVIALYFAISFWVKLFRKPEKEIPSAQRNLVGRNPFVGVLRVLLILTLIVGLSFWCWGAGSDVKEICQILSRPKNVNAQVIVNTNAPSGYVSFSFRASPKIAPVGRFQVNEGNYKKFFTGSLIPISYFESDPFVYRVGKVDLNRLLLRIVFWLLLLANGGAYLVLPLWILEFRRKTVVSSLSSSN